MAQIERSAQAEYASIAEELAPAGAVQSQMFGMPTLKAGGKAFAGLRGDAMVFKLGAGAHARALGLPGAHIFDPSGMGRPMRAWVVVPSAQASAWRALARDALENLRQA